MYTGLDASSRELVWNCAQNDSGCYLTAAEAKALWGTILNDSTARLRAESMRDEAQDVLQFANDTADILLAQVREAQLRIGQLERELAQEAQAVGVLTTALMNGGDELERWKEKCANIAALLCTSDDPNDHQGDTCPIHERG